MPTCSPDKIVVVIVVSAVTVANAPVVINNHLLLVKVAVIARTIVARTIDATIAKTTLGTALELSNAFILLTPAILHGEKAR